MINPMKIFCLGLPLIFLFRSPITLKSSMVFERNKEYEETIKTNFTQDTQGRGCDEPVLQETGSMAVWGSYSSRTKENCYQTSDKSESNVGIGRVQEPTSLSYSQDEENEEGQDVGVGETFGGDGQAGQEAKRVGGKPTVPNIRRVEPNPTKEEIVEYIKTIFGSGGITSIDWGLNIADCESGYDYRAFNDSSGTVSLYQFMPTTFYENGGVDIWDWREQTRLAYRMFSEGQRGQWECSTKIYGY